jgi:hypothetical protein
MSDVGETWQGVGAIDLGVEVDAKIYDAEPP